MGWLLGQGVPSEKAERAERGDVCRGHLWERAKLRDKRHTCASRGG